MEAFINVINKDSFICMKINKTNLIYINENNKRYIKFL